MHSPALSVPAFPNANFSQPKVAAYVQATLHWSLVKVVNPVFSYYPIPAPLEQIESET